MIQPKLSPILLNSSRRPGGSPGGAIVSSTPVYCCCDGIVADRRGIFRPASLSRRLTGARTIRHLRRRGRARGPAFADGAVEGRAPACRRSRRRSRSQGELSLIAPDGSVAAKSRERHGGPPYFWFAEVASPAAGKWQAKLERDDAPAECSTITREIAVRAAEPPRPSATEGSLWPLRNTWNRETENLYSAWIEKLFDAPLEHRCRGRRCMKCCATNRAMCCSTILACARTR